MLMQMLYPYKFIVIGVIGRGWDKENLRFQSL